MSANDIILISSITATAKLNPHPLLLEGQSGKLDEDTSGTHLFVNEVNSTLHNGGPVHGHLYKLHFTVAGVRETIQQMKYIGYASEYKRYIFTKTP